MKSLFLFAFALCAACSLHADEVAPQPLPVEEAEFAPAVEPQTLACDAEETQLIPAEEADPVLACDCDENTPKTTPCDCGCESEGVACHRCKSVGKVLAGCGCKKKKTSDDILVNQEQAPAPIVEEIEEPAAEEAVA